MHLVVLSRDWQDPAPDQSIPINRLTTRAGGRLPAGPREMIDAKIELAWDWMQQMLESDHRITTEQFEVTFKEEPDRPYTKYKLIPVPVTFIWQKPMRRPTKHAGRKGTKRDWKRANSPKFVATPNGKPPPEMIIIGGLILYKLSRLFMRRYGGRPYAS